MSLWETICDQISNVTAESFVMQQQSGVGGGCINTAQRLQAQDGRHYFVKLNTQSKLSMFEAEAEGLHELAQSNTIKVPVPVCTGIADNQAYIVMEDLQLGGNGSMETFAEQLAQMHQCTRKQFGWHRENTIGSTPQMNTWCNEWIDFWRVHRLGYQLELAKQKGGSKRLLDKGERLLQDFDVLFASHQPEASLLHGDLWSGNYAFTKEGDATIFDPVVYFGDREADIAMTELFGGFSGKFYSAYENISPLDAGYKTRKTFYNLYHILNHFNMFGGGYGSQAEGMIERLLSEI
ncbi:MAG: fructosamine kinase family protein [Gammaproteobacteria bacterium]|nr:fructosamine kinase family protein [Gammaproteobacteria bacterium]